MTVQELSKISQELEKNSPKLIFPCAGYLVLILIFQLKAVKSSFYVTKKMTTKLQNSIIDNN